MARRRVWPRTRCRRVLAPAPFSDSMRTRELGARRLLGVGDDQPSPRLVGIERCIDQHVRAARSVPWPLTTHSASSSSRMRDHAISSPGPGNANGPPKIRDRPLVLAARAGPGPLAGTRGQRGDAHVRGRSGRSNAGPPCRTARSRAGRRPVPRRPAARPSRPAPRGCARPEHRLAQVPIARPCRRSVRQELLRSDFSGPAKACSVP